MTVVGDVVSGTVVVSESYGAYVEHDGVKYFVPMHELSWNTLRHASDVVLVGDSCEIIIDRTAGSADGGPLASVRRVHPELNPWADPSVYSVGTQHQGRLFLKDESGWFFVLPGGASGFCNEIPAGFEAEIGDHVTVEVIECEVESQRLRLAVHLE